MYIAAQLTAANKDVLLLEPGNGIAGDAWHNTSPDSDSMPETSSQTKQHELTAAFDKTKILTGKQVIAIACGNKGFTLTDNEGNVYKADKLVCATLLNSAKQRRWYTYVLLPHKNCRFQLNETTVQVLNAGLHLQLLFAGNCLLHSAAAKSLRSCVFLKCTVV